MELLANNEGQALKVNSTLWTIELTDLGIHQATMGYSLSSKYLMIGITSPLLDTTISINSIPENENEELIIPIHLENGGPFIDISVCFKGLEEIFKTWDVHFYDNRIGAFTKVFESTPIPLQRLNRNSSLRLVSSKEGQSVNSKNSFEIRLTKKFK